MRKSRKICRLAIVLSGILPLVTSRLAAGEFTLDTARAAAATNNPAAEYFLAKHYADSIGVARDGASAVGYLRRAAEQGYAPAQTGLGSCYAHGLGVTQDLAEALQWYRRAAAQGEPLAEYCLGYACAFGKGVATNYEEAIQWWQKSAEQGQVYAQNALGQFYLYGENPGDTNHVNFAAAAGWFGKAASQGFAPWGGWDICINSESESGTTGGKPFAGPVPQPNRATPQPRTIWD